MKLKYVCSLLTFFEEMQKFNSYERLLSFLSLRLYLYKFVTFCLGHVPNFQLNRHIKLKSFLLWVFLVATFKFHLYSLPIDKVIQFQLMYRIDFAAFHSYSKFVTKSSFLAISEFKNMFSAFWLYFIFDLWLALTNYLGQIDLFRHRFILSMKQTIT